MVFIYVEGAMNKNSLKLYYKGSAIFSLVFFLSTTSEKSFIPYKASAALHSL